MKTADNHDLNSEGQRSPRLPTPLRGPGGERPSWCMRSPCTVTKGPGPQRLTCSQVTQLLTIATFTSFLLSSSSSCLFSPRSASSSSFFAIFALDKNRREKRGEKNQHNDKRKSIEQLHTSSPPSQPPKPQPPCRPNALLHPHRHYTRSSVSHPLTEPCVPTHIAHQVNILLFLCPRQSSHHILDRRSRSQSRAPDDEALLFIRPTG
jgi:hypothetical protein